LWFAKTFSLTLPFQIFVSFFQPWNLHRKISIATLLDKWRLYLALCEQCQLKKKTTKRWLVVRLILSYYMNSWCQVDLTDMQSEPDRYYWFITNYQDHLTKFTILRPPKRKTAEEVAYQLMDIFCMFGAPFIAQSGNGREFANKIIKILVDMWPGRKFVHGKPRHFQSQGSVERSNQDVRDMPVTLMSDNNTKTWYEWLITVYPKQEKPSSAFWHQDKPLWGYVWNGAEDRTWGFSAHWRQALFNRNWRTGTAL